MKRASNFELECVIKPAVIPFFKHVFSRVFTHKTHDVTKTGKKSITSKKRTLAKFSRSRAMSMEVRKIKM